jgi:hypothetical protein
MEASETKIADAPPDWATLQREILCPLCDYNLRGLTEPRCPECGYRFTWAGLQDDLRNQQEWFFEHQKRRPIRSLVKTWVVSLRPRRFWTLVQPTNPPHLRRLLLYWLTVAALLVALGPGFGIPRLVGNYREIARRRQDILGYFQPSALVDPQWRSMMLAKYGSAQAAAEALNPWLWPWQFDVNQGFRESSESMIARELTIVLLCWPWLILLTMIIFRQTLRQARIKTSHLLRCAIYASDVAPLIFIPAVYTLGALVSFYFPWSVVIFEPSAIIIFGAIYFILCYRLTVAYRYYLNFPHALATCIATQLVAILLMFIFMPWTF